MYGCNLDLCNCKIGRALGKAGGVHVWLGVRKHATHDKGRQTLPPLRPIGLTPKLGSGHIV